MTERQIEILLVEDEVAHIELVKRSFRNEKEFHFTVAKSLSETRNILNNFNPDILITDWRLPDGDAIELIPKEKFKLQYPIIIMTSYGNEELAVDAIKAGALDFIVKSIEAFSKLPYTIKRALREWEHITNSKHAEIALRNSEERYRLLIDQAVDAIFLGDIDGNFISVNSQACELTGFSKEELLMMNMSDLFTEEELTNNPLQYDLLKKGENITNTRQLQKKDNSFVPIEMNTKYMTAGYFQSFIRDISERIRTEELKRKFEETEYLIKVKSQFLANLSHEIRNPLNAIIGLTNTLSKTQLNDEQKKFISSISLSSDNLMSILNDILDLSKIEANKVDIHYEDFHFRNFFNEIISIYESKIIEQGLKIYFTISNDIPIYINTDSKKLKQILINLIGNAIKFTSKGFISIKVEIVKHQSQKQLLQFSVSDTGIGIKKEDYRKIFQSFTQLDSSTKKTYPGTGLGLSITKNYVELLGGKITFDSEFGKGSTFYFQIPFMNEVEKNPQPESIEEKMLPLPKSLHILVAEDDAINRMYLSSFIQSQGWTVDLVKNGLEVLENWGKTKYDILLLDGQMPKMDGFEAAQIIREKEKTNKIKTPIIAITGYTINEKNEQFVNAQMDDYVIKPINESDLLKKIANLIVRNK
jgi:PAS domain S-box-containing protein